MRARGVFLGLSIGLLLLLFWLTSLPQPAPSRVEADYAPLEGITLVVANDLHYLSPELTDHGAYFQQLIENADGKAMEYSEELLEAFVEQVISQGPDALILAGDLTFNGELQSHLDLAEKLQRVADAGIPVLLLPGNHDLENGMAASFHGERYRMEDSVKGEQFVEIYQAFGYQDALARDSASLSYVAELAPNFRVLMVDVNTAETPGAVSAESLAWVEQQLNDAAKAGARVLAVSHQTLLQHNSLFTDGYAIENNARLLSLYERYGVICNLGGHMHIQHIAQSGNGLTEILTSSLAVSPNQYGVLTLEGTSAQYHTVPVDVAAWAAEQGVEKEDLLYFSAYSRAFFDDTTLRQTMAELNGVEQAEQLAAFAADVNAAYFAGRLDLVHWDDALYTQWQKQGTFTARYLKSIAEDIPHNYTSFSFTF